MSRSPGESRPRPRRERLLRSASDPRFPRNPSSREWFARNGWRAKMFPAPRMPRAPSKIAVLKSAEGKLNDNQRNLIDALAASGGRVPVTALQSLEVPRTTLATLVRRGLVEILEEPAEFSVSRSKPRPSLFDFDLNPAQQSALSRDATRRRSPQILRHAAARRHRLRQDCGVPGSHARCARSRALGHPARPGNRSDARRRRRPASDLRR